MQMLTRVHTAGESSAGHEDTGGAGRGEEAREREREREREINTGIAPRENHACNYPTRAWATPFHLHHPPCFTASFITFCPPRLPTLEARLCTPLHPLRLSLHFTIPPSFSRPTIFRGKTSLGSTSSGCVIENFSLHEDDLLLDLLFLDKEFEFSRILSSSAVMIIARFFVQRDVHILHIEASAPFCRDFVSMANRSFVCNLVVRATPDMGGW